MAKYYVLCLCLLVSIFSTYDCANILVLETMASPSHHIWIRTVMHELVAQGHNVTSISSDVDKQPVPNLHYIHLENTYAHLYSSGEEYNFVDAGEMSSIESMMFTATFSIQMCEGLVTSKGVHTLLNYPNNFKFDLVLHDNLLAPCLIGFLHKFGYPPLVHITAFHSPALSAYWVGSQFHSYVKPYFRYGDSETFLGRAENYGLYFMEYFLKHYYTLPKMNAMSKKLFPDAPSIFELEKRAKLVLINSHPAIEIVEPLLPIVIPVGGLQIQAPGVLPDDLKEIADSATNGLVLFSLGTNVRSSMLGNDRLTYIIEAFRKFPKYTFLWKIELDKFPVELPKNVHVRRWIPQTEILNHKNTILFVTHSGLLSSQESIWYGVPMLSLPVFADQNVNSKLVKRFDIGEVIPVAKLNATNLKDAMALIFNNLGKYRANSVKLSKTFRDQPELPLQRAVWWIEWVLRNPDTDHLNCAARDLNVIARHSIDIILFGALILGAIVFLSLKFLCVVNNILKKFSKNNKVKRN